MPCIQRPLLLCRRWPEHVLVGVNAKLAHGRPLHRPFVRTSSHGSSLSSPTSRRQPTITQDLGEKLMRISYMSTMNGPTDVANEAMEKIVPKAAKANRARGVTGQLSYDAALQQVWQVLEGDSDAVAFLWERIQVDSRHVIDMDTVLIETVDARTFPLGWGLKLRTRGMDIV
mmetsp:Transcript_89232/g.251147  ORF Transcript_89232/g.251147 Transcript_89232/m.251147 type:complete len:172 (+) Transcript_89232:43-558(+)